jgi:enterochelin esterase family protein
MLITHAALAQPPKGKTTEIHFPAKTYPSGRHGWVYTPAGYPRSCNSACNLIVVFDGAQYLDEMPLPGILDSLTAAKKVAPTVAILFDNGSGAPRLDDLANSKKFASFVATELINWARQHYAVTHSADRTIIAGSSAGGLEAAYIALYHSDIFGKVLSQSGAFWRGNEGSNSAPYEWLTQQYSNSRRVNVRFFLDVGSTETRGALGGAAPSLSDANRRLRDALNSQGYQVDYFEVPGGVHSPESWAKRLPIAIAALNSPVTGNTR